MRFRTQRLLRTRTRRQLQLQLQLSITFPKIASHTSITPKSIFIRYVVFVKLALDLPPIKTCILDQPDPKLHSGSTVPHLCSWAHPNADSVLSRLGIGGRFRAMPVELVSVYAEVPIPGVPGTKLGF